MEQRTHLAVSGRLVGVVREIGEGTSRVTLETSDEMAADARGLVHGGFTFGLADYAVMVAVNDPCVVLGGAEVRFTAPVRVGQALTAAAKVIETKGKKRVATVQVQADGVTVLEGTLTAFVLDKHILG